MNVGDRFKTVSSRHWKAPDGTEGDHAFELLCEIVMVDDVSAPGRVDYECREVLGETGRPEHMDPRLVRRPPHDLKGQALLTAAERYAERGDWIFV